MRSLPTIVSRKSASWITQNGQYEGSVDGYTHRTEVIELKNWCESLDGQKAALKSDFSCPFLGLNPISQADACIPRNRTSRQELPLRTVDFSRRR